jgi:hypothetical protein
MHDAAPHSPSAAWMVDDPEGAKVAELMTLAPGIRCGKRVAYVG